VNVPHPEPTTRAEARANAISLMFDRDHLHMAGHRDAHLTAAHVWSQIALTFPEEPTIVVDNYSDFPRQVMEDEYPDPVRNPNDPELEPWQADTSTDVERRPQDLGDVEATMVLELPRRQPSVGHVEPSGNIGGMAPTIQVEAVAWDVLRVLAIRYVLSSIQRGVTVDLTDEDTEAVAWDLQFARMPDSPIVHVSVSRPDGNVTG
jgi:hypothetical protein